MSLHLILFYNLLDVLKPDQTFTQIGKHLGGADVYMGESDKIAWVNFGKLNDFNVTKVGK